MGGIMTNMLLSRLREIRAEHARQRTLEQELAAYTSERDLNDLGAVLDRYDDAQTAHIRGILAAQHLDPAA
jgi:hypothetical protein